MTEPVLIAAAGLGIRRGGADVIEDATFTLGPGLWLLRGANGSGKSTLLRVLAGVGNAHRGTAQIAGHDLVADPVNARTGLGFLPQSADIFGYLTVREFLETVASLRRADVRASLTAAQHLIHAKALDRRIDTLSAGQRRKLCLTAARCGQPKVLLLDEPDAALDSEALADLGAELGTLADAGRAGLVATHHDFDGVTPRGTLDVVQGRVVLRDDSL